MFARVLETGDMEGSGRRAQRAGQQLDHAGAGQPLKWWRRVYFLCLHLETWSYQGIHRTPSWVLSAFLRAVHRCPLLASTPLFEPLAKTTTLLKDGISSFVNSLGCLPATSCWPQLCWRYLG